MPLLEHAELEQKLRELLGDSLPVVPPDMQVWEAGKDVPVIVLVHGHAVTKRTWTDPYSESTGSGLITFDLALTDWKNVPDKPGFPDWDLKNLCLSTPLRLLANKPEPMWDYLKECGYNLITWTQREPNGRLSLAVEELDVIIRMTEELFGDKPIVLLCHSRGGLVARKYIQEKGVQFPKIRKVILLSTPNHGTKMATLADVLGDVAGFFNTVKDHIFNALVRSDFKESQSALGDHLSGQFSRFLEFLQGEAIDEMRPDSALIRELKENEQKERDSRIPYVNLMGTSNTYTRLYLVLENGNKFKEIASFFDLIPDLVVPDELDEGKGDGLVSIEKVKLSWVPMEERDKFDVNHASILTDEGVRERVKEECEAL